MRPPSAVALAALALPLPALGQQVIVRTDPPRATLVCDGRVVGVTPVAFDPSRVRTCTLFARGHANLAVDPAALTGVIASYRLEPVTADGEVPCGAVDPRNGLVRVCFHGAAPPSRAPGPPGATACGGIDPQTGLMRVCFPPGGGRPSRDPPPAPVPTPPYGSGCGQIDPHTGLMNVCFNTQPRPRPRARPSPPGRPCGTLDPATGLLRPCFD